MRALQKMRLKAGLSQSELAAVSGIKTGVIQKYEIGYRNIDGASLDTLCKLSYALNCKIYDILEDEQLKIKLRKSV